MEKLPTLLSELFQQVLVEGVGLSNMIIVVSSNPIPMARVFLRKAKHSTNWVTGGVIADLEKGITEL